MACSPASIRNIARHSGIPTHHAPLRPTELDDSVWLRQQRVDNRRSLVDIAAELGCSAVTVRSALARQDVWPRDRAGLIALDHGRVNELLRGGIAPREIARIVGYSSSTVHRIAARSGNPIGRHKPRPAELDDRNWLVARYVQQNESVAMIARHLAVHDATVRAAVNRLRITRRQYPLRRPAPSRLRRDLDRYGNINAVARAHRVSWDTVEHWYAQIGIFQHKRPSITKRDLRQALRNRATTSAAARTLGVTINRVRVERLRHGL